MAKVKSKYKCERCQCRRFKTLRKGELYQCKGCGNIKPIHVYITPEGDEI